MEERKHGVKSRWWLLLLLLLIVVLIVLLINRSCSCGCDEPARETALAVVEVEPVVEAKPVPVVEEKAEAVEFDLSKLTPVAWAIDENGYVEDATKFRSRFEEEVSKAREARGDYVNFPVSAVRYDLCGYDMSKVESDLVNAIGKAFLSTNQKGKLLVEGYTCNVGQEAFNEKLSRQRAERVGKILTDAGVPSEKVQVKWYGMTKYGTLPGVTGQEAHRRVTVTVVE